MPSVQPVETNVTRISSHGPAEKIVAELEAYTYIIIVMISPIKCCSHNVKGFNF
jgi:hypothetical protein